MLKFNHRYNFEYGWDGGAIFVSVNGGAFTYLSGSAFSQNGYSAPLTAATNGVTDSNVFPGLTVFTGESAGWGSATQIESIATLGTFTAGETIAVEFRGGWDWAGAMAAPNWEIGTVQVLDGNQDAMLNADFVTQGRSGFAVTSDEGLAGPWSYEATNDFQFELNAATETADRLVPASPAVIDLNNARLKVVVLNGELSVGQSFSLFDLTGGSTLQGTYSDIQLPAVQWDLSGLQPGGNGRIVVAGGPVWEYTWNNSASGTFNWESANWDYAPTDPAPATTWPNSVGAIVNLPTAGVTWNVTSPSITVGEIDFGATGGNNVNGTSLVFDNGIANARISRGNVGTTNGATFTFNSFVLDTDLDIDVTSHVTSGLAFVGPISGTGGLNVYNATGEPGWPGFSISGVAHTYQGGTTVNNGTLTLEGGGSILGGVVLNNGMLRLGLPEVSKTQGQVLGGAISGTGTVMTFGRITFDDDTNSWQGPLSVVGDFPQPVTFTSIGNVGGGASALGNPQTPDQGRIYLRGGGSSLVYTGSGNSTDRIIEMNCFGGDWTTSIIASGTSTVSSPLEITSNLAGSGTGWLVLGGSGAGKWSGEIGTMANRIRKSDAGTWNLAGSTTYTGETQINEGTLIVDGTATGGGAFTVASGARLGGNGSIASAVTVNSGAKLVVDVSDWSGGAGVGYADLAVNSLGLSGSWTLDVASLTGFANFTETDKVFAFVTASGGITGFNAANCTIVPNGFPGSGSWSVRQNGNSLELVYTAIQLSDYDQWAALYSDADLTDPTADFDGDGMSNFHEYAFGLAPNDASSVNPITEVRDLKTLGEFNFTRRAGTGRTYTVWISTDLGQWTSATYGGYELGEPDAFNVETIKVVLEDLPTTPTFFVRVGVQ